MWLKLVRLLISAALRAIEFLSAPRDSWRRSDPSDILFFASDADRMDFIDGLALCRVLDPLRALFELKGYSATSIAYRGSKIVGKKTTTGTLSISRAVILGELRDSLGGALRPLLRRSRRSDAAFAKGVYAELLQKLKPQLIFVIDADPIICSVAARLKIPVLEVLHARGYGDVYEGWKQRKLSELPDGVIAYDDLSATVFGRLLPTLRVTNFRTSFEREVARRFLEKSSGPFSDPAKDYRHVVLFTASWDADRPYWPGGLPRELIEVIRQHDDLFLLVRLHPVMRVGPRFAKAREAAKEALRNVPNSDIEWASTAPIYAVLEVTTVHFTFQSMSAYEAYDMGLSTYAIDGGKNIPSPMMQDLKQLGVLVNVGTDAGSFKQVLMASRPKIGPRPIEKNASTSEILAFAKSSSEQRRKALGEL